MQNTVCVYASASEQIAQKYFKVAESLGRELALRGDIFLFGGGLTGLMGATACAVHQHHGRVIGVIPEALNQPGVVYHLCDELIVTAGLRERKAIMDARSDAFIALPGGFGTLEEILEIITLKQLKYHCKPVVIINVDHFYDFLLAGFEKFIAEKFATSNSSGLFQVAATVDEALNYIDKGLVGKV